MHVEPQFEELHQQLAVHEYNYQKAIIRYRYFSHDSYWNHGALKHVVHVIQSTGDETTVMLTQSEFLQSAIMQIGYGALHLMEAVHDHKDAAGGLLPPDRRSPEAKKARKKRLAAEAAVTKASKYFSRMYDLTASRPFTRPVLCKSGRTINAAAVDDTIGFFKPHLKKQLQLGQFVEFRDKKQISPQPMSSRASSRYGSQRLLKGVSSQGLMARGSSRTLLEATTPVEATHLPTSIPEMDDMILDLVSTFLRIDRDHSDSARKEIAERLERMRKSRPANSSPAKNGNPDEIQTVGIDDLDAAFGF